MGNRTKKRWFFLLTAIVLFSVPVHAQTYYSKASTNFSLVSTWTADTVGNANVGSVGTGATYVIRNGHSVTLNGTRTIGQLTIRSGGTLTVGGSFTLTSGSELTVNTGGTITVAANAFTIASNWTNNGTITVSTGQLIWTTNSGTNNNNITISSTGRLVRTSGSFTNSGAVSMAAGSLFIGSTGTFDNTTTGTLIVSGSATITLGAGNFTNSNPSPTAVNFGTSQISLTGSVAGQTIGGFSTTGAFLTSRSSGNLITVTGDIRCHNMSMTGNGYTMNLGDGLTHMARTSVTLATGTAGADLNGGSSILYVYGGGTVAFSGTGINFVPGTSTVVIAGAAAQTIGGTGVGTRTFYNLTLDGANTKTNTNCTVNNILTLQGATTAVPSTTFTFGPNATLRYNSAVNRTTTSNEWPANIAAGSLGGGVLIENAGDISLNGSKVLGAGIPVTIETTAVLTMGTNSLTISSDLTNNGGALNGTSATNGLVLTGTANQSIGAVSISGPVIVAKPSNTVSVTGNITAGGLQVQNTNAGTLDLGSFTHAFGAFTGTSGSWNANSSLTTFSGSATYTSGTLTANSSTISFTGNATQNIPPYVYNNLGLSGSGTKNILTGTSVDVANYWTILSTTNLAGSSNITVAGDIYGTGNLTMGSGAMRIGGNWAKTGGSFTAGTGTVLYYGTTQEVGGNLTYNNLQIANAGVKTMAASSTVMSGLTIHPSATLELGTLTLTLSGAGAVFTNNGTLDPGSSSTVHYTGNSGQNIAPATYHNLSFTGGATKTVLAGAMLTVNNNWNVHSTTNLVTTGSATVTGNIGGGGGITQGTGGTISLAGAWTNSGALAGTGTVEYRGGAQTIATKSYNHLQVSNPGIKTLAASTTIAGVLTVNPASTISMGGFTLTLSGAGTPLVNNGTFDAGSPSTVQYSGASGQEIASATYHNLSFTGAGTKTIPAGATLTVNNNWNIHATTDMITTGSAIIAGNLGGGSGITQGTGGVISLAGAWTNSGTLTGTGTVNYNGTNQTVANAAYHHLTISNSGIKTLATSTAVKGQLTINPSNTIDIGGFTLTLSGTGTPLQNNGDFIAGNGSTVHYSSTGSAAIAALDYYNLLSTGGSRTLEGTGTIGILGSFMPVSGSYDPTTSTVDFKGSGIQFIPAFTFNKLIVSNAGIKHIIASIIVNCKTIDIEDAASVEINATSGGRLNVTQ